MWGSTAADTSVPGPWFSSEEPWSPLDAEPLSGEPSSALKFHISLCCPGLLGYSRPSALTGSFRLKSWAWPAWEAPLTRMGRGMCVRLLGRPDGLVMSPGVGVGGGCALLVCPLHGAASVVSPEACLGCPTMGFLLPPAAPPSSCSSKASSSSPTDDLSCFMLPALLPHCWCWPWGFHSLAWYSEGSPRATDKEFVFRRSSGFRTTSPGLGLPVPGSGTPFSLSPGPLC